ncbi:MAG: hypothetical protein FJ087_03755, partial [Deltaproteobacteria bacterium]|nr:hypothetical protein [Deltaproteobacteria bacterium]
MSGRRSGTCGAMSWAGWGALLAALATAGCGSGGETPGPITDPGGADRPGGDALPDGLDALPDGGDDAEPADAEGDGTGDGGWDGGGDGGGDGVTPPDGVEPDANGDALPDAPQCPGGAGCPCGKNDDCVSGMCLESSDGWVCTQLCAVTESCPAGWVCVTMISGPDVVQVCADPFARLCRPCRTDADCAGAAGAGGDAARCLPRGAEGSFCGTACDGADECPEGYECLEAAAGAGGDRAGGGRG